MKDLRFMAALCSALCWVSCADDSVTLVPFIEIPPESSTAYPYEGLEEIELSIARAGDDAPLALSTAAPGDPLTLVNVPFAEDLVVHFSGKASGVEISYGRTCPVSVTPDAPEASPRLYFSRIVRWGATAGAVSLSPTRTGGHAYSLAGGSAVFVGGDSDAIEVFDPVHTGELSQLAPRTLARAGSVLLAFAGGAAIVVGGTDPDGDAVPTVELVNPEAEAAGRQLEDYPGPALSGHAGATLVDDTIVVAGGAEQEQPGGPFVVTGSAWRFRLGPGGVLDPPARLPERMQVARARHSMTRLGAEVGADVLVVGGLDEAGQPVSQAELYRPLREAFEAIAGADLLVPRWDHAAVRMPGGFVLIIGGMGMDSVSGAPVPVAELELYDPILGQFTAAGTLPGNAGLTELSVTPLPDGRALLAGGRDVSGNPVATVLIARLDPLNGQVELSPTDRLQMPRAGHSAVSLCDGTIAIAGGTQDSAAPVERYNPPSTGRR